MVGCVMADSVFFVPRAIVSRPFSLRGQWWNQASEIDAFFHRVPDGGLDDLADYTEVAFVYSTRSA